MTDTPLQASGGKPATERRIALTGPDFFSYIQAVRDEFIRRGYPSKYHDERHSNSVWTKIAYRLQFASHLKVQRQRHLDSIRREILADGTTDLYLISTEVINLEFVQALKAHQVRVHLYMWDSAGNKKGSFLPLLPVIDSRSSFEPDDCKTHGMTYIPLFAEQMFSALQATPVPRADELVFLGTLHSHRAKLLSGLERAVRGSGMRIRKLLFYHSRALFACKCLFNWRALRYLPSLRTRSFDKAEIAAGYFRSKAVLDIHHPGQAGLTSRTFESLRAGAWLITLNKTVDSLPAPLRERVVVLDNVSELADRLNPVRQPLPPLAPEMDRFLSLERFADDLLNLAGLPLQQVPSRSGRTLT